MKLKIAALFLILAAFPTMKALDANGTTTTDPNSTTTAPPTTSSLLPGTTSSAQSTTGSLPPGTTSAAPSTSTGSTTSAAPTGSPPSGTTTVTSPSTTGSPPGLRCYHGVDNNITLRTVGSSSYDVCGSANFRCMNCTDNIICTALPSDLVALLFTVCSPDDMRLGTMRRVYLGYTSETCQLAITMSGQPGISAMVNNVICCSTDGCNSLYEPPPATPPPVVTPYVVRLALSLPLTRAQFNATAQLRFREQMAVAAGMAKGDAGRVNITISDAAGARRLLAGGLMVNVSISMDSVAAAQTASAGLTETAINKALAAVGLPAAQLLSLPSVTAPSSKSWANSFPKPSALVVLLAALLVSSAGLL